MEIRDHLLVHLKDLEAKGHDCRKCVGLCCTDQFNTMKITLQEAQTIQSYLENQDKWNLDLLQKLKQTIVKYRLDLALPGNGKRSYIRRSYTCTFYELEAGGCQLPRTHRPLGCLAFNPLGPERIGDEGCAQSFPLKDDVDREFLPVAVSKLFEHSSSNLDA